MMMYFCKNSILVILLTAIACLIINCQSGQAFGGTFGYDVHHRYSDTVKAVYGLNGLPDKGTVEYYHAMAHRDQLFNARRLATTSPSPPPSTPVLTFFGSNMTVLIKSLGFLHYSVVSVGTPPSIYLVALDTGSDLFWLPCDCPTCPRSVNLTNGETLDLHIYSPSTSSTGVPVSCSSSKCGSTRRCSKSLNACSYQEIYLPPNTSSSGILVDDVLHLGTDTINQDHIVKAPITLGCGMIQTGDFVENSAINGLLGLGRGSVSVPSILASSGLTANSFSMCFGADGLGRIEFGDKGSPTQKTTPFNLDQLHPTYNITVTQVAVKTNVTKIEFTAIFKSGSSFTYLNDPAYSVIVESFDSQITEPRYRPVNKLIFDYCYELSSTEKTYLVPDLNLTMTGGDQLHITAPTIVIPRPGRNVFCLAIVKSEDINIIGQNFMTGYRIVFDRDENVLGWTESDCYDSNTIVSNKPNSTTNTPPPSVFNPQAPPGNRTLRTPPSAPPPTSIFGSNDATRSNSMANNSLLMVIFSVFLFLLSC